MVFVLSVDSWWKKQCKYLQILLHSNRSPCPFVAIHLGHPFFLHFQPSFLLWRLANSIAYFLLCFVQSSDGNGKAFLQKERLLRFDRDFARRTQIFDDQADYQAPSTWMTEEEKKEAEENQRKHLESLKRPKQRLNLAI